MEISDHQSSKSTQGPKAMADVLTKATEKIDALYHTKSAITGIETGLSDLDKMTAGLQRK